MQFVLKRFNSIWKLVAFFMFIYCYSFVDISIPCNMNTEVTC